MPSLSSSSSKIVERAVLAGLPPHEEDRLYLGCTFHIKRGGSIVGQFVNCRFIGKVCKKPQLDASGAALLKNCSFQNLIVR